MDNKPSECIDGFLKYIREANERYNIAQSQEKEAEMETQDILHWLEFNEELDIDGDGALLVLGAIGMARRKRRAGKDAATVLQPVVRWTEQHKSTMNSLEQLLGDARKAERSIKNRHYTQRTRIVEQMVGPGTEGG